MKPKTPLPIDDSLPELLNQLRQSPNLILKAEPGAGKTTRLPPALLELGAGKVLVLEPRRVAAVSAAARIAEEQGWQLGQEVGYRVRYENKTNSQTRLIFVTEALLSRQLLNDPTLKNYDTIVLDEFHERSLHTDLAIGLLRELQTLERPDLRLVVMSATLDPQPIADFLGNSQQSIVPGRSYPLEIKQVREPQQLRWSPDLMERIERELHSLSSRPDKGPILSFFPGVGEIRRMKEYLEQKKFWSDYEILELHGQMSLKDQKAVLSPTQNRRLILATNVAESALTIDGVHRVLDTGLSKQLSFHPRTGVSQLQMGRISKANAKQRAGRAGRQGPGYAVQMWNSQDEQSMPDFELPQILREDLADTCLLLAKLGVRPMQNFSWYQSPPAALLLRARQQLQNWGLLTENDELTSVGKIVGEWPVAPRWGRLLFDGRTQGHLDFAIDLVALMSERSFERNSPPGTLTSVYSGSDLLLQWDQFQSSRNAQRWQAQQRQVEYWQNFFQHRTQKPITLVEAEALLPKFLLVAYRDRLCRRRRKGEAQAQMANGMGVRLSEKSSVQEAEFFFALDLIESQNGEILVSKASQISETLLRENFQKELTTKLVYSVEAETKKPVRRKLLLLDQLVIETSGALPLEPAELMEHLAELALQEFEWLLRENTKLSNWWSRWQWYCQKNQKNPLTIEKQKEALSLACYGEKNLQALSAKDLNHSFESVLDSQVLADWKRLCPAQIQVPSGRSLELQYSADQNPILEVRIQEIFGWTETPKVMGQQPVTLHLLGPNYRPMQVTQDLGSFWKNAYAEVRKELRSRYPKHSWPEDPTQAVAEARGPSQRR